VIPSVLSGTYSPGPRLMIDSSRWRCCYSSRTDQRGRVNKNPLSLLQYRKYPRFDSRSVLLCLEILEQLGSSEARKALQELARGAGESALAREAQITLNRFPKRALAPKRRKP